MSRANETAQERLLRFVRRHGVVRARDVESAGLPRTLLSRLSERGLLERLGRGLYSAASADQLTENHSLVEASKRVPGGVIGLLSALRFHELTTQNPSDIWMLIENRAWKPRGGTLPLRFFRASGRALTEGVEHHRIEGVDVPITSREKTLADAFKYRRRVGQDVALEALRTYLQSPRRNVSRLSEIAEVDRVAKVMRPYLEALA